MMKKMKLMSEEAAVRHVVVLYDEDEDIERDDIDNGLSVQEEWDNGI